MLYNALLFPLFFSMSLFMNRGQVESSPDIKRAVEECIDNYSENVAVYYYRLDGKKEYYLNEDKVFRAASLSKVPQAMEVLDKVSNGELSLDTIIEYSEEDYEEGTGILKLKENIGSMTVKEALELSLLYSDNIANNMLNRICGYDLNYYISKLSGEDITVGNITTAKEQVEIYRKLYSDEKYSLILDLLKKTCCHDRLDKYIENDKVAHKFGNYYRYYHDAGIIYDENPYILVVLTKDIGALSEVLEDGAIEDERRLIDDGEKSCELIAEISIKIYQCN